MTTSSQSGIRAEGRWLDGASRMFPPEFDPAAYRALNSAVERLADDEARAHYRLTGRPGGWRANGLAAREDLLALLADAPALLEIGDEATRSLPESQRATLISPSADPGRDGPLYDAAVSNHLIQTVPDLAKHLRQVGESLKPGGFYIAMIPDKRYCLDHYQPATTIAAVLDAHRRGDVASSWRAQLDSLTLSTHNDPVRHWLGDHGAVADARADSIAAALRTVREPGPGNDDGAGAFRTWFFTPSSFRTIVWLLRDLGLTDLEPFRIYPTLRDNSEFWAVLRKPEAEAGPSAGVEEREREDASPVLPYDSWTALKIPAAEAAAGRGRAIGQLADRETEPERQQRYDMIAKRQTRDAIEEIRERADAVHLEFPAAPAGIPPSLTRPIPGMNRVLVSFCERGPSGILLGLYTPTPVQYFQPLRLPAEVAQGFQKAHGIAMDGRSVYVALGGAAGQALLVLSREDLSFSGLHTLRRAADVHSIHLRDGWLYAVSTGTDEVLRYPLEGGVPGDPETFWSSPPGERVDLRHLNAIWPDGEGFLVSAMDRRGIFPARSTRLDADGVILSIPSGEVVAQGLWFPHSVMRIGGDLAYVQSGCSTVHIHGQGLVRNLPGLPRGLCRIGDLLLVGTSETTELAMRHQPTPTIRCSITQCLLSPLRMITGLDLSYWGCGIYDLFPLDTPHTGD